MIRNLAARRALSASRQKAKATDMKLRVTHEGHARYNPGPGEEPAREA